ACRGMDSHSPEPRLVSQQRQRPSRGGGSGSRCRRLRTLLSGVLARLHASYVGVSNGTGRRAEHGGWWCAFVVGCRHGVTPESGGGGVPIPRLHHEPRQIRWTPGGTPGGTPR